MSLQHAILSILYVMPLTGYDLKHRAFDQTVVHFWPADQAQIYRTLDRLTQDGLLEMAVEEQDTRPDRKVYSITEAGRAELRRWLEQDQALPAHRDPFLIRLFFATELPDETIQALLEGQERQHRARLAALQNIPLPPPEAEPDHRWQALQRMTLDLGLALEQTYLDWIARCRAVAAHLPPLDDDPWRLGEFEQG